MKDSMIGQIKQMISDAKAYLQLQIEEGKLIGAQKGSILISAAAVGIICLVLCTFTVFLFSLALVAVFKTMMAEWLAYLTVGGILIFLSLIVVLFRKYLIVDPVCRFITRLIFEKEHK